MIIITSLLAVIKAAILKNVAPQNFDLQNPKFQCEKVYLNQNTNFQFETQEQNVIQKTANNFEDLFSQEWNKTFINLIYEDVFLPLDYSILQTKSIKIYQKSLICSLIQCKNNLDYQIYCTQDLKQNITNNKLSFSMIFNFSYQITQEKNLLCQNFLFIHNQFHILCINQGYINIFTLDINGNKQQHQIDITNTNCKTKFQHINKQFLLVQFYKCQDWEIIVFDKQISNISRITISTLQHQTNNITAYQYLQNLKICQTTLLLQFKQNQIQIHFQESLTTIKFGFFNETQLQFFSCQITRSNKFQTEIEKFIISAVQSEDFIQLNLLDNVVMLFQFSNRLIAIIVDEIRQTINIEINQLLLLKDDGQFLIIDYKNQFRLFKLDLFQIQYSVQQSHNFVAFYQVKFSKIELTKCIEIDIFKEENQRLKHLITNIKNNNYYIEIDDNFDNKIYIDKSNFIQHKNISLQISITNIFNNERLYSTEEYTCKQFGLNLTQFGQFYFFTIYSVNYLLLNDEDYSLIIYNCSSSKFKKYHTNIDLNTIETYYEVSNQRFILIQESLGKIISFNLELQKETAINYKIYQFNEQIRSSCIYIDQLVVQLVNSTELYYEDKGLKQFNRYPHHNKLSLISFDENFKQAIKVFIIEQIIIYQFESHLFIQQNLPTKELNTFHFNLKDLNILGGYIVKNRPLQLILILLQQKTNILFKYLITQINYYLISTYQFADYFPTQPLFYQIYKTHLIIVTQKEDKNLFYLLIFNFMIQQNFDYYKVIQSPYKYFHVFQFKLYYYNEKELLQFDLQYDLFNFYIQNLNKLFYNLQLKIQINCSSLQQSDFNQLQTLDLILFNQQKTLKQINESNPKLIFKNDYVKFHPNQFVIGYFNNLYLINNTVFNLQSPFKVTHKIECIYFKSTICITQEQPYLVFQDLSNQKSTQQQLNFSIKSDDLLYFYSCNKGQVLVQQQSHSNLAQIIYFTKEKQYFAVVEGMIMQLSLKQSILFIQTTNVMNYYFIEEGIQLLEQYSYFSPVQFYFSQIGRELLCKTILEQTEINIFCFSISQGLVGSQVYNYTILLKDIYNQIKLNQYLGNFREKMNFEPLDFTLNQENNLVFKFLVNYQQVYIFYYQITLNIDKYVIKLNNIIRAPQFMHECKFQLLKEKLFSYCKNLMYLYDVQNEFQIQTPYAAQINNQFLHILNILNNTHIAIKDSSENSQVSIIEIDDWYVVKKPNLSLNGSQFLSFAFNSQIDSLELIVDIKVETNQEIESNLTAISIITINFIFVIAFIKIKKLKKR